MTKKQPKRAIIVDARSVSARIVYLRLRIGSRHFAATREKDDDEAHEYDDERTARLAARELAAELGWPMEFVDAE